MHNKMACQHIAAVFNVYIALVSLGSVMPDDSAIKGPVDVCERDSYNASCPHQHMILMHSAMYGRMSLGTCIKKYFSNSKCDVDVLHILDGMCSGLQYCDVRPLNPVLFDVKPCPEQSAYLTISYKCIKEASDDISSCSRNGVVHSPAGYLSSAGRHPYGPGTVGCPWVLGNKEGQRYNITLYKFVPFKSSPLSASSSVCFEIGTIQEGGLAQGILTCGTDPRLKVIFLSKGGRIQIHLKDNGFLKDLGTFALHYEEIGCNDPSIPKYANLQRSGNRATVTCDNDGTSWDVTCENGEWSSHIGQCSAGDEQSTVFQWIKTNTKYSLGLLGLVTLGCSIVIFLGGFCLYAAYFYITGKHKQPPAQAGTYNVDAYKLQTMEKIKRPPSIAVYERTTSLYNSNSTLKKNTDYQRMNPIDPETASHHSYVLYDHVPKPLPPIPIEEKKHIYETPLPPEAR